jgi:polyhydroxyalkanoate synthase
VINPAAKNKRSYWATAHPVDNADDWLTTATETPGSWWPLWADWLKSHGGRQVAARRRLGSADFSIIEPAPGRYVREKA